MVNFWLALGLAPFAGLSTRRVGGWPGLAARVACFSAVGKARF